MALFIIPAELSEDILTSILTLPSPTGTGSLGDVVTASQRQSMLDSWDLIAQSISDHITGNAIASLASGSTLLFKVTDNELYFLPGSGSGGTGDSAYVYIAYADDASGTGFTTTFNASKDYIAIKSTTIAIPTPVVSDFTGLWKNYKGVAGDSAYVYIAYADDTAGTGFTMTFNTSKDYIAIKSTNVEIPSPSVSDFIGLWKKMVGHGVAPSGSTGQFLVKASDANYDTEWISPSGSIPPSGSTGQVVMKQSNENYDYNWADIIGLIPASGNAGQRLTKLSNTSYDVAWVDPIVVTAGYAANVYLTNASSSVVPAYHKTSYTNEAVATEESIVVTGGGEVAGVVYLHEAAIGITDIDPGRWSMSVYGKVSSTAGDSRLRFEVYSRASGSGTETTLFSAVSDPIDNISYQRISIETIQPQFIVSTTDTLGLKIYASASVPATITFNYIEGGSNPTYLNTPLSLRHTQLRGLNDDPLHLHITSVEKGMYANKQDLLVSGVNIKTINSQSVLGPGNIEITGGSGSVMALDDLTDVNTTGVTHGQALIYNSGSNMWVPGTIVSIAGLAVVTLLEYGFYNITPLSNLSTIVSFSAS